MSDACGRCGRDPAAGYAKIDGVRYCHGDEDYPAATCYMRASWEMAPQTMSVRLDRLGEHGANSSAMETIAAAILRHFHLRGRSS